MKLLVVSWPSKIPASQLLRFLIIAVFSNAFLYLIYIVLTGFGLDYKTAMTLLFVLGTLQTFLANKRWTFSHQGLPGLAFLKYASVYCFAYLINFLALVVLVDYQNIPHQIVQAGTIPILAVMLFLLQKFWVFRCHESNK